MKIKDNRIKPPAVTFEMLHIGDIFTVEDTWSNELKILTVYMKTSKHRDNNAVQIASTRDESDLPGWGVIREFKLATKVVRLNATLVVEDM